MKFQANVPFKLTKMFYEKLGEQPKDKRVLVIRDLFTAMHASIDNAVTFITDDKEAYELFSKNVVSNDEFCNDDTAIFVDTEINKHAWKDFIKELVSMPKFDIAIMNPPYDKNLHLKILEKVIPIADKVVNISPVRWLQDPLAKYKKNSDYNKFENSISKKIESLDIVSAKSANVMFGAIFGMDLAIYKCNNSATVSIDYTRIQNNIILRVVDHMWKNQPIFDNNKKDGIRIRIPFICGGKSGGSGERKRNKLCEIKDCLGKPLIFTDGMLNGKPWYDYYMKNQYSKTTEEITCSTQFSDENSAKNFYDSVNTKFYKYIHHNVVLDVNVEPCKILFMSDYTQPWDDKRFCEYFNITGYIDDEHAVPNSEWEIILNTMNEYV